MDEVADTSKQVAPDGEEEVLALGERLRNWGAWGDDDEKGTLNYITPAHRIAAAQLVRRGAVFSLALPIRDGKGPMRPFPAGRFNPVHRMTVTGCVPGPYQMGGTADFTDDLIMMGTQTSTQWDALCHVYYGDKLYNGFPASSVDESGAHRNAIGNVREDMVARGVLLDVAALHGVTSLEPGHQIMSDELAACRDRQGVDIRDGDMLLVRTGFMSRVVDDDWSDFHTLPRPGLHYSTATWMKDHRISAIASDNNAVEATSDLPSLRNPFHMVALRDMGVHLGEFWYLDELAADCAEDNVYEFMLVAPPLYIERGAGSPVNPLALK